jgi:signal transduction histidine kinase
MNLSILVIDDEPDNFDVIETLLNQQNYELHYAARGQEAIDSLDIYQPDLILLDVMMPGIDGIEVCRQIKAMSKWQAIPIIMVTALDSKSDLARCLNAGADDFISKPINALELRARVHSMLRIKQQYDELQSLLQLREDMVQMLIHDLRNPLTGILLNLELLRDPAYPKDKHPDKIAQIHTYASILQRLIDDLLQIYLIESDKLHLNLTQVEIGDLIQSAVGKFESIAAQRNLAIVVQLPESPQRKISVDAPLFQRVIDNLLSNAIKFSPRKSQIIINAEFLNANIKIQVIDSGPGVPEALQKTIFQKYEIGTRMPDVAQIGLGLAFCKMVVEAHEGEIQVMNNQPKGSIFEITLRSAETGVISAY